MDAPSKCILKGLPTDPQEDGESEKLIQSYILWRVEIVLFSALKRHIPDGEIGDGSSEFP